MLKDKVILITGASRGIGLVVAEKCLSEYAIVIANYRKELLGIKYEDTFRYEIEHRKPYEYKETFEEIKSYYIDSHNGNPPIIMIDKTIDAIRKINNDCVADFVAISLFFAPISTQRSVISGTFLRSSGLSR